MNRKAVDAARAALVAEYGIGVLAGVEQIIAAASEITADDEVTAEIVTEWRSLLKQVERLDSGLAREHECAQRLAAEVERLTSELGDALAEIERRKAPITGDYETSRQAIEASAASLRALDKAEADLAAAKELLVEAFDDLYDFSHDEGCDERDPTEICVCTESVRTKVRALLKEDK